MRMLSLAIVIFAMAIIVSAGAIADALGGGHGPGEDIEFVGVLFLIGSSVLFYIEWRAGLPSPNRSTVIADPAAAGSVA